MARTTTSEQAAVAPEAAEIVAELKAGGLDHAAERIAHLLTLDDDDPDETPIDRWSLRAMADLLLAEPRLGRPRIGVGADGLMHTEWVVPPDGLLVMEFLANGLISFSGAFGPPNVAPERAPISATLPAEQTLEAARPLIVRIAPR